MENRNSNTLGDPPFDIHSAEAQKLLNLVTLEAWALPSDMYIEGDSHTFVVTQDKTTACWHNFGRCWEDAGPRRTMVASVEVFYEWMNNFCPASDILKCGLYFGLNGVCHTYANRELLLGVEPADVKKASKDYVVVFIFGKYGLGVDTLKQLVKTSFEETRKNFPLPDNALDMVYERIDGRFPDEFEAWRQTLDEYIMPIDTIWSKDRSKLEKDFMDRLMALDDQKQKLYGLVEQRQISGPEMIRRVHAAYHTFLVEYLAFLQGGGYITIEEQAQYQKKGDDVFLRIFKNVAGQQVAIATKGELDMSLAERFAEDPDPAF